MNAQRTQMLSTGIPLMRATGGKAKAAARAMKPPRARSTVSKSRLAVKPSGAPPYAAAPSRPMLANTKVPTATADQRLRVTLTPGRFSFTQLGTVATKQKLKSSVPMRGPAREPATGTWLGSPVAPKLASQATTMPPRSRKHTFWTQMLSSRL
jgi:hypothetical protein